MLPPCVPTQSTVGPPDFISQFEHNVNVKEEMGSAFMLCAASLVMHCAYWSLSTELSHLNSAVACRFRFSKPLYVQALTYGPANGKLASRLCDEIVFLSHSHWHILKSS